MIQSPLLHGATQRTLRPPKLLANVFDYTEMFYDPKRLHGYTHDVSIVEFERQYFVRIEGGWGLKSNPPPLIY